MNSKLALSLVIAVVPVASAWAEGPIGEAPALVSTAARGDVLSDFAQFKRSGPNPWASSYDHVRASKPTRARPEVAAEYASARDEVRAMTGEDSGSSYFIGNGARSQPRSQIAHAPRQAQ